MKSPTSADSTKNKGNAYHIQYLVDAAKKSGIETIISTSVTFPVTAVINYN